MIQYSVKYAADSNISKRQAATYVWDWKLRRFVLDECRSQLSAEEIEAVYGGGVIEDEKFVAYYNSEFRQIAKHGSARRKNWLRKALSRMDYTPHKTDLEKMLR
jgi:hypothetical protein